MKKNKQWFIWLIVSITFLGFTQLLFSISAPCKYLEAVWEAGDLISFVGTMVLGFVAINQTQQANKMSERLMDIESNRYMLEIRPFVMVTDWKSYELNADKLIFNPDKLYICIEEHNNDETAIGIGLQLQNTTDSFLTVEYCDGYSEKVKWLNSASNQPNRKLRMLAGENREIIFYANSDFMKSLQGNSITIEFILENRFAERYKESFNLIITASSNECIHKQGEWYCGIAIQNYKIGKFAKDSNGNITLKMEEETSGQT